MTLRDWLNNGIDIIMSQHRPNKARPEELLRLVELRERLYAGGSLALLDQRTDYKAFFGVDAEGDPDLWLVSDFVALVWRAWVKKDWEELYAVISTADQCCLELLFAKKAAASDAPAVEKRPQPNTEEQCGDESHQEHDEVRKSPVRLTTGMGDGHAQREEGGHEQRPEDQHRVDDVHDGSHDPIVSGLRCGSQAPATDLPEGGRP